MSERVLLQTPTPKPPLWVKDTPARVFIDSGAFSAWKLSKPVNLDAYCDFLEEAQEWSECYAALDVIIPDDPEEAAKQSFDNLVLMRSRGLDPIPVFHVREDIKWLQKMLDLGCDYIGLSATSIVSQTATDHWYDLAWSYLVDQHGAPLVKVHAFGESRMSILTRHPWRSADTSTWLNAQKHGIFFMEDGRVLTQQNKGNNGSKARADISDLEGEDAVLLSDELLRAGVDPAALVDRSTRPAWLARSYLAARKFHAQEAEVRAQLPVRFKPERVGGLLLRPNPPPVRPRPFPDEFTLYLAVGTNNTTVPSLYFADHHNFLASYFYIGNKLKSKLREYCNDRAAFMQTPPFDKYFNELRSIVPDENK